MVGAVDPHEPGRTGENLHWDNGQKQGAVCAVVPDHPYPRDRRFPHSQIVGDPGKGTNLPHVLERPNDHISHTDVGGRITVSFE